LDTVYVVEGEIPIVLISDITLTSKGVVLVQGDESVIGIAGGKVVLVGHRNKSAARTELSALLNINLRHLLLETDPRLRVEAIEGPVEPSAEHIMSQLLQQHRCDRQTLLNKTEQPAQSYGASPTYSISDVREGRRVLKNIGGISALTVATTLERGAFDNVPTSVLPALLRAVSKANGNIP
jgi:hypothetical protein